VVDSQGPLLPILGRDPNTPKGIRLVGRYALGVDWEDGHGSIYPFEALRQACGCTACQAAPSPSATSWPVEIKREAPGLRIRWQDGHETTFGGRELRLLCRCAACAKIH
jgi:ATP-binding protein involved in chromosome partitioning